jgi:hypothetical protein
MRDFNHLSSMTLVWALLAGCGGTTTSGPPAVAETCVAHGSACTAGQACCDSQDRCVAGQCSPPHRITGACASDADCENGKCLLLKGVAVGMCSEPCIQSSVCGADAANAAASCYTVPGGGASCALGCTASADCHAIGADWSCNNWVTVEGYVKPMCLPWKSLTVGAPCREAGQCASGVCSGAWCTEACTRDTDCGSGNWCVYSKAGSYICFPGCAKDSDCVLYGSGAACHSGASTATGGSVNVCAF